MQNGNYKKSVLSIVLIIAGCIGFASTSMSQSGLAIEEAPVESYAECVISSITSQTEAEQVEYIQGNCRYEFPDSSHIGLFGWANAGHCYDVHVDQSSNLRASLAIFNACSDYFL